MTPCIRCGKVSALDGVHMCAPRVADVLPIRPTAGPTAVPARSPIVAQARSAHSGMGAGLPDASNLVGEGRAGVKPANKQTRGVELPAAPAAPARPGANLDPVRPPRQHGMGPREHHYDDESYPSKIMRVATTLPETFTAEDLVAACFKRHPDTFGLHGYRDQYPCSQRVWSKVYGSTGLIAHGFLESVTTKVFRVTAAGRLEAERAAALRKAGGQ